jgi:hypothetical protein
VPNLRTISFLRPNPPYCCAEKTIFLDPALQATIFSFQKFIVILSRIAKRNTTILDSDKDGFAVLTLE